MATDPKAKGPTVGGAPGIGMSSMEMRAFVDRAARSLVKVPMLCRFPSFIDFVETQSLNVSRTGMYLICDAPPEIGTKIEFEFSLDDGYVVLKGTGIVVRKVTTGAEKGMGVRFVDLDDESRKLIDRIVDINKEEGIAPSVPFDFSRPATGKTLIPTRGAPMQAPEAVAVKPIQIENGKLRLVLSPATAGYFTYNPLLNIKMGGFFIPAEIEIPLGTLYKVEIVDMKDQVLLAAKGKVVAKQELRIGVRMSDVDKEALARLQALVTKLAPAK
jgi:uncharacterized protein (TIGR02266 family)